MRIPFIFLSFFLFPMISDAQQESGSYELVSPEYTKNIEIADSLYNSQKYAEALEHFNNAFRAFKGRATDEDLFKVSRIYALLGKTDSAFLAVTVLANNNNFINYRSYDTDPAFESLKKKDATRFKSLVDLIKQTKEKKAPNLNLEWAHFFDTLQKTDEVIRKKAAKLEEGAPAAEQQKQAKQLLAQQDLKIAKAVTSFIDKNGWQSAEIIGEKGASMQLFALQRADVKTLEKYLPQLKTAVSQRKADRKSLAFIEDRISVAKTGEQIYGTQVKRSDAGIFSPYPIKDEKTVDQRRSLMHLESLADYLKLYGIDYTPPQN